MSSEHELKYCVPLLNEISTGFLRRFGHFFEVNDRSKAAIISATVHPYFKTRWIHKDYNTDENISEIQEMLVREALIVAKESAVSAKSEREQRQQQQQQHAAENSWCCLHNKLCYCFVFILLLYTSDAFFHVYFFSAKKTNKFKFHFIEPSQRIQYNNENAIRIEVMSFLSSCATDDDSDLKQLDSFPHIRRLFIKYNTILASSAPVERLFSYAAMILRPQRRSLLPLMFEKLMVLRSRGLSCQNEL